jgi:proteasome lid subunit RPN8/RPN11
MAIVRLNNAGIERTLDFMKQAGKLRIECVVLWLAKRQGGALDIQTIYLPQQIAERDFFRIPQESIKELLTYLRHNGLMVAAQVHTHPGRAFHSLADDTWAIIRHFGGLSLVIPRFACTTSTESFIKDVSVFRLSEDNCWEEIHARNLENYLQVIP